MRTNAKPTIYISDFFTVPMPTREVSRREYLRKLKVRRVLWALLPYCLEAAALMLALAIIIVGISFFVVGLGG